MTRKPPELGTRVSGVRAEESWEGKRRPAYVEPRDTVVGEVRKVFPKAPDVAVVFTDGGELRTVRDVAVADG